MYILLRSILQFSNVDHAVFSKDNEGAKYQDATSHKGSSISPGNTYTYHWFVPKRAAPGPNDGPCITWAYYSSVDPIKDTNSGLIGPLITCRKVSFLKNITYEKA